jgi:exodeoxyribonuclease VII small subunit
MPDPKDELSELSYEQKVEKLDEILTRLDNSETPIDKLAEDVKLGARLIKELDKKLKQVETEVRDAFKELEGMVTNYKFQWIEKGNIFTGKKKYLKIPFSLLIKGLDGRSIVIETLLSEYDTDSIITSHKSLKNLNSNLEKSTYAHLFQDKNFIDTEPCIVAVDIKILSEYKDIIYEDRRLIRPWK